jgi:hypothetical protein
MKRYTHASIEKYWSNKVGQDNIAFLFDSQDIESVAEDLSKRRGNIARKCGYLVVVVSDADYAAIYGCENHSVAWNTNTLRRIDRSR